MSVRGAANRTANVVVLVVAFTSYLALSVDSSYGQDFRSVSWGMSQVQVMALEKANSASQLNGPGSAFLTYTEFFGGTDAIVEYTFDGNQLYEGQYSISGDVTDSFETSLTQTYGHGLIGFDSFSGPDYDFFESEFVNLSFSRFRSWSTATTDIILYLYSDSGVTQTYVCFFSKKYVERLGSASTSGS